MTSLLYQNETYKIRGVLFKVYNGLGPGFLEKIYQRAVIEELKAQRIPFENEKKFAVHYKSKLMGYNAVDLVIYGKIILELKAVNKLEKFHLSQMLAYLKASGLKLGLVANFGASALGIKRVVNQTAKISA